MTTAAAGMMTAEELAQLPDDGYQYELVRGVLRRTPLAGFLASNTAARVGISIGVYVKERGLGEITGADGGYVLERNPDTVWVPDVAFVRADRVPAPEEQERFAELPPDLAVEVVSPSGRMADVEEKVEQYLALGVPLVWVFHPRRRTVTDRRAGQAPRVLGDGDELHGEDVLPGFQMAVGGIFR